MTEPNVLLFSRSTPAIGGITSSRTGLIARLDDSDTSYGLAGIERRLGVVGAALCSRTSRSTPPRAIANVSSDEHLMRHISYLRVVKSYRKLIYIPAGCSEIAKRRRQRPAAVAGS